MRTSPESLVPRVRPKQGFTLLEILVALGVFSIAAWIFISLFMASHAFSQASRENRIAAGLAEDQLHQIACDPSAYVWPSPSEMKPGEPRELQVRLEKKPGPYATQVPLAKTLNPSADRREKGLYTSYTWQAFATLPASGAAHLDVTVVVRWTFQGKEQSVTLSSAIPVSQVEGLQ